jgi:hypothetical protein
MLWAALDGSIYSALEALPSVWPLILLTIVSAFFVLRWSPWHASASSSGLRPRNHFAVAP